MKQKLLLSITIWMVTACYSCTDNPVANNLSLQNEETVKKLYEYFNAHQWKEMAALYTDTADFKDPSLGNGIIKQSRQQTQAKYEELNKLFPDIHDEVIQIYPSGEKNVIVEFVSSGTGPDGNKFTLPVCTIFTIEENRITKDFTYYDNFE